MKARTWTVRVTAAAETDFRNIVEWTAEHFGAAQARAYAATLSSSMSALVGGPTTIGVKARNEIATGLFTLHVAREGRKGRHFVMFRTHDDPDCPAIEVLRLLHDTMDLPRHLQAHSE